MPPELEPVILGDLTFEAGVRRLDLSLSSDLPRHPVERGFASMRPRPPSRGDITEITVIWVY